MARGAEIRVRGNAGGDAEKSDTHGVTNFSIAVTDRVRDGDGWKDGETTWYRVAAWNRDNFPLADWVAETVTKGTTVEVVGKLKARTFEKDGETRVSMDVTASDVLVPLAFQTATVEKVGNGKGSEAKASGKGQFADDPPF